MICMQQNSIQIMINNHAGTKQYLKDLAYRKRQDHRAVTSVRVYEKVLGKMIKGSHTMPSKEGVLTSFKAHKESIWYTDIILHQEPQKNKNEARISIETMRKRGGLKEIRQRSYVAPEFRTSKLCCFCHEPLIHPKKIKKNGKRSTIYARSFVKIHLVWDFLIYRSLQYTAIPFFSNIKSRSILSLSRWYHQVSSPFPDQSQHREYKSTRETKKIKPRFRKGDWICPDCQFHNYAHRSSCSECSHKIDPRLRHGIQGDWICPHCDYYNFHQRLSCKQCEALRPRHPL
ncbi:uncharacterized protein BX664DRAFT_309628 [Halteromyces radiatus]|uniref:uncharacterized protein n=1 Tax=Halteromyces radiatus TaxID=101107 RepID=UPI00221F85B0|nr:uncharacterized protein BX664DRAFT_309628 [Halteromyces radiatus]KAI8098572.1 hypothetical protein BX664DRAFT_309628 [Halteromyces radiatus]